MAFTSDPPPFRGKWKQDRPELEPGFRSNATQPEMFMPYETHPRTDVRPFNRGVPSDKGKR